MNSSDVIFQRKKTTKVLYSISVVTILSLVSLLFASNMIVAKLAAGVASPFGMAFWRWCITAIFLIFLARKEIVNKKFRILEKWRWLIVTSFFGMGLCGAPIYIAGATTKAVNIGLIMAASPLIVFFWVALKGSNRIGYTAIIGLFLCFFGVVFILTKGNPLGLEEVNFLKGDIIVLFVMFSWAAYTVRQAQDVADLSVTAKIGLLAGLGAFLNLPIYLGEIIFAKGSDQDTSLIFLIYMFVAIFPGILAYWSYGKISVWIGSASASLLMYLVPVANALLATLILNEQLFVWHYWGGAMVLFGIFVSRLKAQ